MKDITTLDREYNDARKKYDEAIATGDWSAADHYSYEMRSIDDAILEAMNYYEDDDHSFVVKGYEVGAC